MAELRALSMPSVERRGMPLAAFRRSSRIWVGPCGRDVLPGIRRGPIWAPHVLHNPSISVTERDYAQLFMAR